MNSTRRGVSGKGDRTARDPDLRIRDDRWALGFVAVYLAVQLLPYLACQLASTDSLRFAGLLAVTPQPGDTTFHLSWAKQVAEGAVLLEDQYSGPEHGAGLVFNLMFLLWGGLSRLLDGNVLPLFHVVRTAATVGILAGAYGFGAVVFSDRRAARAVLALATLSSGFGWLVSPESAKAMSAALPWLFHRGPADNWFIEATLSWATRWEVMVPPSAALVALALLYVLRFALHDRPASLYWAALFFGLLPFVHPHDSLTVGIVATLMLALKWRHSGVRPRIDAPLLVFYAAPLPKLSYDLWIVLNDPALAAYLNIPDPWAAGDMLLGYGPLGLLALAGLVGLRGLRGLRGQSAAGVWLCAVWPLTVVLLVVTRPHDLAAQVFIFHGLQIPLAVLAVFAVRRFVPEPRQVAALSVALVAGLPSTVARYADDLKLATDRPTPAYLSADTFGAFEFLDGDADRTDVVIAPLPIVYFVPSRTGAAILIKFDPYQAARFDPRHHDAWQFLDVFFGNPERVEQMEPGSILRELHKRQITRVVIGVPRPDDPRAADMLKLRDMAEQRWRLERAWSSPTVAVYRVPSK